MSERDRLDAVLARLAGAQDLAAPVGTTRSELLVGILRAIDETVLPRQITISVDDKEVVLLVARRRLLSISGAISEEFSAGETGGLAALADGLAGLFLGTSPTITQARPGAELDAALAGVSVTVLAGIWAQDSAPTDIGSLAESALAAIVWDDGGQETRSGDESLLTGIAPDRTGLRALSGADNGAVALDAVDTVSVFLWSGAQEALLILPAANLDTVLRSVSGG